MCSSSEGGVGLQVRVNKPDNRAQNVNGRSISSHYLLEVSKFTLLKCDWSSFLLVEVAPTKLENRVSGSIMLHKRIFTGSKLFTAPEAFFELV